MIFELWDMRSRNAIGSFESKSEALAAVRELVEDHGRTHADDLFLGCEDEEGNSKPIAKGRQLADLALRSRRHEPVAT